MATRWTHSFRSILSTMYFPTPSTWIGPGSGVPRGTGAPAWARGGRYWQLGGPLWASRGALVCRVMRSTCVNFIWIGSQLEVTLKRYIYKWKSAIQLHGLVDSAIYILQTSQGSYIGLMKKGKERGKRGRGFILLLSVIASVWGSSILSCERVWIERWMNEEKGVNEWMDE